jgi:hypothetical protein
MHGVGVGADLAEILAVLVMAAMAVVPDTLKKL